MKKVYYYSYAYFIMFFDKLVDLIDNSDLFACAVWGAAIVMFLKLAGWL